MQNNITFVKLLMPKAISKWFCMFKSSLKKRLTKSLNSKNILSSKLFFLNSCILEVARQ